MNTNTLEDGVDPPKVELAPWLTAQLGELLAQNGHAWLLQGPSGLGQYELGLALASAWLCETVGNQGQAACGHCASCHMVASRTHPDLVMLMPETALLALGWPLSEKAQSDIDDKKRKPSREIRVDAMQAAIEFAQRTNARGRGKAVLVYPAERMNHVTANGLLKTLEEPVGDVKFILATEAAHQLLPTIRSRCQAFAMRWPAQDAALLWLAQSAANLGLKTTELSLRSALLSAGGRPLDALDALQSGLAEHWQSIPRSVATGQTSVLANLSTAQVLDALQKLCHDLMALRVGAQPRFYDAQALPKAPGLRALGAWANQLKTLAKTIDHTWKAELLVENLLAQARSTLAIAR